MNQNQNPSPQNNHNNKVITKSRRLAQVASVLKKYDVIKGVSPEKLRMILEDLGPTFVKLGQIMSSRTDIISEDYCKELAKLRSSAEPMSSEEVEQVIVDTYGKKPEELFASFDLNPIGAASMAQVHQAKTFDGHDVVVKIQRPNIYSQMEVDVEIMKKAAKLLNKNKNISSIVDLTSAVDEFWHTAKQELDFRKEAENAVEFGNNYKDCLYVKVPKIYEEFTKRHVLVMEDIQGVEIDNYPALNKLGYSRSEIANKLAANYIDQVVDKGFFHADPHSGNLRIQDGKIAWLDFGMMGHLTPRDSRLMKDALQAVASSDSTGLTDAVLALGKTEGEIDYTGFSNQLDLFIKRYASTSLEHLDMTQMVMEMIQICRDYGIMLPEGITMLARSLVTIEGTMKDLDPTVNVFAIVADQKTKISDIDWESQLSNLVRRLAQSANQAVDLPVEISDVLKLTRKGQLKVVIRLSDLDSLLPNIDKMVDRIIVCVLIAALLMGSSIICTTNLKPKFLDIPLLGLAGFFISFCLSIWLFIKMLFKGKNNSLF